MSEKNKKTVSIVGGITILSIVGIICKFIGVLYRIPLALVVGKGGLGAYQLVFPTYSMLLTISSAGLPVAISRMISYSLANNDPRNAKKTFKIALYILTILGFITMLLMIIGSDWLSARVGDDSTKFGFIAIAPSLLIVCVMSAFRGFMQGQQDMKPTAYSQLIEQVGKVGVALPLAYYGAQRGFAYGAAGALLGISLAEALALFYIVVTVNKNKVSFEKIEQNYNINEENSRVLLRKLLVLAIPITLGACIVPLASFVDSAMLVNRMHDIGFTTDKARSLYGLYSGLVITLINVPTALAIAISMSIVPAVSNAIARKDFKAVEKQSKIGLRFAFLIGLPCSTGLYLLAKPIMYFFYSSLGMESVDIASNLLEISSLTIILFTVVQATSGILQGLHKQRIPMYTLMAGVAIKIFLNYILVGNENINIKGAPIASIVCYTISMLPNIYYVCKYGHFKFDYINNLLRPSIATIAMGICIFLVQKLLPFSKISTLILLIVGLITYTLFAYLSKAITTEDIAIIKRRK